MLRNLATFYRGKGERNECKKYRSFRLLSGFGKIDTVVLVDTVRIITARLIDLEEGRRFRLERGYVDQIYTWKLLSERYIYGLEKCG